MKGDRLPEQDHISRYCSPKTAPDGQPTLASFMPRSKKDPYLSVNWLEYFDLPDQPAQIAQLRQTIGLTLAANGKFAVLNVGEVIDFVEKNDPDKRVLDVLHEPEEDDKSHSGIYGYSSEDIGVAQLIAEVVIEIYPAKENSQ
jgi:hypothetical protein